MSIQEKRPFAGCICLDKRHGMVLQSFVLLLALSALFGCPIPLSMPTPPPTTGGPKIHSLAKIDKSYVYPSSMPYINSDGYATGQINNDNTSYITSADIQYIIEFVTDTKLDDDNPQEKVDSHERWIPYKAWDVSRCGPFKVRFPNFTNRTRDVGLNPYIDPCDQNDRTWGYFEFCAVFEDGLQYPQNNAIAYLYIESGLLWCRIDADGKVGPKTDRFMVVNNGQLDRGYDFLLDFKVKYANTDVLSSAGISDVNSFIHFFAIYDKTLLDEAQTYCNNDSINDWTCFYDYSEVADAVAYSKGGTDDVGTFNMKMEAQRDAIFNYFSDSNIQVYYPNIDPPEYQFPDDYRESLRGWNVTTAPPPYYGYWSMYIFTGRRFGQTTYDPLVINGISYTPYLPGLASYNAYFLDSYVWQLVLYSAGTDCNGFLQRVASYNGNNYWMADFSGSDKWVKPEDSYSFPLYSKHSVQDIVDIYSRPINYLNGMVPGDILINPDTANAHANEHVAIVLGIEYPTNSRLIASKSSKVTVIEAAKGDYNEWRVINTRTWEALSIYGAFELRRLR